jgi:hypothetical protein
VPGRGRPRAGDKPDYVSLLVGKWEVTKAGGGTVPTGGAVDFTEGGKITATGKFGDREVSHVGRVRWTATSSRRR